MNSSRLAKMTLKHVATTRKGEGSNAIKTAGGKMSTRNAKRIGKKTLKKRIRSKIDFAGLKSSKCS